MISEALKRMTFGSERKTLRTLKICSDQVELGCYEVVAMINEDAVVQPPVNLQGMFQLWVVLYPFTLRYQPCLDRMARNTRNRRQWRERAKPANADSSLCYSILCCILSLPISCSSQISAILLVLLLTTSNSPLTLSRHCLCGLPTRLRCSPHS